MNKNKKRPRLVIDCDDKYKRALDIRKSRLDLDSISAALVLIMDEALAEELALLNVPAPPKPKRPPQP